MATWAYRCRSCDDSKTEWYVSQDSVSEFAADVQIVRVKVGNQWRCARLERTQGLQVEQLLVRSCIASSVADCPECAEAPAHPPIDAAGPPADAVDPGPARAPHVQSAKMSHQGADFMVVLVTLDLVRSPGEADMALDELRPQFAGLPVVLVAQDEEDQPVYYGDPSLVGSLGGVPLEAMPWS